MNFNRSDIPILIYVFNQGFYTKNEQYAAQCITLFNSIFNFISSSLSIVDLNWYVLVSVN